MKTKMYAALAATAMLALPTSTALAVTISGVQWARLAVATSMWLVVPALIGLRLVSRSEVK